MNVSIERNQAGNPVALSCGDCHCRSDRPSRISNWEPGTVPEWIWDAGFRWHDGLAGMWWSHECPKENTERGQQ